MRNRNIIDALLPKVRQEVLAATLLQPQREWYLSDLARHLRLQPSSLQRELAALVSVGILKTRRAGRMNYFQADSDCPIYPELRGLLTKTAGLVDVLRDALAPVARKIACAFVYGSIARSEERSASDVDLLIVGDVTLSQLAMRIRRCAEKLGREVNPKIYGIDELAEKSSAHDHFLRSVLRQPKLFVYGTQNELDKITH